MHQLQGKILEALDDIRPALQKDGGDVEFVDVDLDNIVTVRLTGACQNCPMSEVTLKEGIEKFLKSEIPAIKSVQAVTKD
ncbi:NifU family protein [Desulfogranum marinum]|jgi:Fe-S cluster biogenesis protein NfuA|uniref:NifU family protein n=1 Tax=Desulfogranum marinum TaxID=453220 RepID=UPI0019652DE9|nr:NifU family protein [Desulfogranum marinum]MBM9511574.1 NifU family protein [Desulfogranum marinum]